MRNFLQKLNTFMLFLIVTLVSDATHAIEIDNKSIISSGKYIFRIAEGPAAGEAWIVGMRTGYTLEGEVQIPGSVTTNGKKYVVTRIGDDTGTPFYLYEPAIKDMPLLTKVIIPSTIKSIHTYEFLGCPAISEFHVNSGNTRFKDENGLLYYRLTDGEDSRWNFFRMPPATKKTRFTIQGEDDFGKVYDNAFADNRSIKTLVLKGNAMLSTGWAYRNLGIREIDATESRHYTSKDGLLYYGWRNTDCDRLVACPPALNVKLLTIPSSVKTIDDGAFTSCQFEEVAIPPSVTYIGRFVFYNSSIRNLTYNEDTLYGEMEGMCIDCKQLQSVTINGNSNDFIKIFYAHFLGCDKLCGLKISSHKIQLCGRAFYGCESLKTFPFDQLYEIEGSSMKSPGTVGKSVEHFAYSGIEKAIIPEFCEWIPKGMFRGSALVELQLANDGESGPQYIFDDAFRDCKLTELNLHKVRQIDKGSFVGNPLKKVVFPMKPEMYSIAVKSAFSPDDETWFYITDNDFQWYGQSGGTYITSKFWANEPAGWDTLFCPGRAAVNYDATRGKVVEMFSIEPVGHKSGFIFKMTREAEDAGLDMNIKEVTIGNKSAYYEDGMWRLSYGGAVTKQNMSLTYTVNGVEMYTYYPAGTFDITEADILTSEIRLPEIEKIFTLHGEVIEEECQMLPHNVYIVKYSDGSTRKIIK